MSDNVIGYSQSVWNARSAASPVEELHLFIFEGGSAEPLYVKSSNKTSWVDVFR